MSDLNTFNPIVGNIHPGARRYEGMRLVLKRATHVCDGKRPCSRCERRYDQKYLFTRPLGLYCSQCCEQIDQPDASATDPQADCARQALEELAVTMPSAKIALDELKRKESACYPSLDTDPSCHGWHYDGCYYRHTAYDYAIRKGDDGWCAIKCDMSTNINIDKNGEWQKNIASRDRDFSSWLLLKAALVKANSF